MSADLKTIANNIKNLASDPDMHAIIIKDEKFISGLIGLISVEDDDVLLIALQTMKMLCSNQIACSSLANRGNILVRLATLTDKSNTNISTLAKECLGSMEYIVNKSNHTNNNKSYNTNMNKTSNTSNYRSNSNVTNTNSNGAVNTQPRYVRGICVYINNISTKKDQLEIEKILLQLHGIVSVSVNLNQQSVTIYTSFKQEEILDTITNSLKKGGFEINQDKSKQQQQQHTQVSSTNDKKGYINSSSFINTNNQMKALQPHASMENITSKYNQTTNNTTTQAASSTSSSSSGWGIKSLVGSVTSYFW